MNIKQVSAHTNNYGKGRAGKTINKIILHWIVGTLKSADATFKNPDRKASAHYGIGDGEVHQYVQEQDTAWHASNLSVNQQSIGIEHEGGWLLADKVNRFKPTEATHQTSGRLVYEICKRYGIPINTDHILPHKRYANTQCPGTLDINKIIAIARSYEETTTPTPPASNELEECLMREKEEIKAKDDLYKEKTQEYLPRIKELETEVRTHKENWVKVAEALPNTPNAIADILGAIESLKQQDWQSMVKAAEDKAQKAEAAKEELEKTIEPMAKEKKELRDQRDALLKDKVSLTKENEKLKTAAKLKIVANLPFGLYLASEVKK